MLLNKRQLYLLAILLILLLAITAYLLKQSFASLKVSRELDLNFKREVQYGKVYTEVIKLTENVQDYILFSDIRNLDDFRRNSAVTIKNQMELLNVASPSKKQEVEELIEYTRAYSSFVEKEVVPLIQSKSGRDADIKYLQLRHKDYAKDLKNKADSVTAAGRNEMQEYIEGNIIGAGGRVTFALVFMLLVLSALAYQLTSALKPFIVRHLYLGKLAGHIKNAVLIVDRNGSVIELNRYAAEFFGISPETLTGKNLGEVPALFPQLQIATDPLNNVILRGQELTNHRVTYIHGGRKLELVADYLPVFFLNYSCGAIMVASLAEAQKDKHMLLDTLETERKRISIEIHDWIGRHMSTMIHSLEYIMRLNNAPPGDWKDSLTTLQSHCQNAAIEMRGIMNDIHPYLIDRVGLISALESYISTFERLNNIKVYVLYQDRSLRVKKKDEIIIYRIIQEALANVSKHSRSTEVDIDFTVSSDTLKIEISDNGGDAGDFTAGNGLWGMKERANLIGGDIIFYGGKKGFRVVLTVPASSEGG